MKGTNKMKIVLVLIVALSVVKVAHAEQVQAPSVASAPAQQLKAVPINSYVLTDSDGTPLYLVQHSTEWKSRKVYHVVKQVEQENSSPPERVNRSRRSALETRVNSTQSWKQFNWRYGFTEM
jgi:hypothetical protein